MESTSEISAWFTPTGLDAAEAAAKANGRQASIAKELFVAHFILRIGFLKRDF
jgi:hypothetical protein